MNNRLKIILIVLAIGAAVSLLQKGWQLITGTEDTVPAPAVTAAPAVDTANAADYMIQHAIRANAYNPGSIEFINTTYNWHKGAEYAAKYIFSERNGYGNRVNRTGYAKVRYLYGDISDPASWKVVESYVE